MHIAGFLLETNEMRGDNTMNSMSLDSVLTTTSMQNPAANIESDSSREKLVISEENSTEKTAPKQPDAQRMPKKTYDAVSVNGDTVELSKAGKKLKADADAIKISGNSPFSGKKPPANQKISDTTLAGYSKAKLKQMYRNKQLTKQRYERIMKKKDSK